MMENEKTYKCKAHGKTLKMYCENCDAFICTLCLESHVEKGCTCPINISTYIKKNVLPKYEINLKMVETKKGSLEEFSKNFKASSERILKNLMKLRLKLITLLRDTDKSIEQLSTPLPPSDFIYNIEKAKTEAECAELKKAIEDNRIEFLIRKASERNDGSMIRVSDGEYIFIEALEENIEALLKYKVVDTFLENLKNYKSLHEQLLVKDKIEIANNNIYGVCRKVTDSYQLCRYSILTRKLEKLTMIPYRCTITQIGKRIFVSGGEKPAVNNVSEYLEDFLSLITKASMNFAKFNHATEVISGTEFVSIGGYNGKAIKDCEKYNIIEDKWELLPSLNFSRYGLGTSFILSKYLYAIGGSDEKNTVELLNIAESKEWIFVALKDCTINLDSSLKAFPISSNEIMLLCGGETSVGIFDTKENIVKKAGSTTKLDRYNFNTVSITGGNAYTIGNGFGHIHIYNFKKGVFEDLDFSEIYTS